MNLEEEIAQALYETDGRYAWTWDELVAGWEKGQQNGLDPNYPHLVKTFRDKAAALMPLVKRAQAEAWSEGHSQALANIAWPHERKGNPYAENEGAGA